MRAVFILCLLIGVALAQRTTKYDNVDVDLILSNNRVLTGYIKCMLGKGYCTSEGRELKRKWIYFFRIFQKPGTGKFRIINWCKWKYINGHSIDWAISENFLGWVITVGSITYRGKANKVNKHWEKHDNVMQYISSLLSHPN